MDVIKMADSNRFYVACESRVLTLCIANY